MDLVVAVSVLQAAYCRGIDERDPELLRSVVADDVELIAADGTTVHGADEFVALFERYWRAVPRPGLHLVTNIEVHEAAGPRIPVTASFHAVSTSVDDIVTTTWGRYRDDVTRDGQGAVVFAAKRIHPWGRVRNPAA